MERVVEIRTGESISIRYELAGLGSRFLAVSIDFLLQAALAALLVLVARTAFFIAGISLPSVGSALVIATASVLAFLIFSGYFVFFETVWNGSTPGKRAIGIRVIRDGGFSIDFTSALIRNAIRSLEFGFGVYAVSTIVVLLSAQNKRLGDFAAGTVVVRDLVHESMENVVDVHARGTEFPLLTTSDWNALASYCARRHQLDLESSIRIGTKIAARLRSRVGAGLSALGDDDLLSRIAGVEITTLPGQGAAHSPPRPPRNTGLIYFRPIADADSSLVRECTEWLERSPRWTSANAHILEIRGVPSGFFAYEAANTLSTTSSISFIITNSQIVSDEVLLAGVMRHYRAVVLSACPKLERVVVAWTQGTAPIRAALERANFVTNENGEQVWSLLQGV